MAKSKDSKQYWADRAEQRFVASEKLGNVALLQTNKLYKEAQKRIEEQIKAVYDNYSEKGILDVKELKKALTPLEKQKFLKNIDRQAKILGLDPKKIYDKRYLWRINRLEAIREQIKLEIMATAPKEKKLVKKQLSNVAEQSYKSIQTDFDKIGVTPAFATLDRTALNTILASNWYGGNYDSRIWTNTSKFAVELPTLLAGALTSGESYQTTTRILRDRFKVKTFEASRVIRTETAYIQGQSELQSYIDDGVEWYEYHAELDERTSTICRKLNRQRFRVRDAIVGVNYPPMHPNCRSTTVVAYPSDVDLERKQKLAREDRFERFKGDLTLNNDIEKRFKHAMQQQMNPNKAVYDYNAELNIITKKFKGEELNKEIASFMDRLPTEHPLRGGFEKVAKLHGWKDESIAETTKKVQEMFEEAEVDLKEVHLTENQKEFVIRSGVKLDGRIAEGGVDNFGAYDKLENKITLSGERLKYYEKQGAEDFYNATFQHELGHAIDHNSKAFGAEGRFAYNDKFSPLVWNEDGFTNEAFAISKFRTSRGLIDKNVQNYFKELSVQKYKNRILGGGEFEIGDRTISVPASLRDYHLGNSELFAEAYSIFHVDNRYLKKFAPKIYDYINLVDDLTVL